MKIRTLWRRVAAWLGRRVDTTPLDHADSDWYVALAEWRAGTVDDIAVARVAGLIAWRYPSIRPWEDCDADEWSRIDAAADAALSAGLISGGAWTAIKTRGMR